MKKTILGLCLSLIATSVLANTPVLKDLHLGSFEGKNIISKCSLTLEENAEGEIVATFRKGGLVFRSRPRNPDLPIMVSSNNQVWFNFTIEGMTHVNLMFNNEYDLKPISYVVLEGRDNRIYRCKNLE